MQASRVAIRLCVALFTVSFVAAPSLAAPAKKKATPKSEPAKETAPIELELVHELGPDQGAELQKIVDRFNAANAGGKIRLTERKWDEGETPDLMILGEASEAELLSGKPRYRPLHLVMSEAKERMDTLRPPAMMSPISLDASGKLVGLPVGLATPIMYFNKEAFRKAGLDPETPPKTWMELQNALGQLSDKGVACPYTTTTPAWVHVENLSAWHNQAVAVPTDKKGGEALTVNSLIEVKHLAMMKSWVTARYLHIFGPGLEAQDKFASGQCAVLTGPSTAYPSFLRSGKFDVGVAPLPYHDDVPGAPQNTLADGPVLWIGAGKKPAEYRVAAKFVNFVLEPQTQVEWQVQLGSLPLNRAGLLASSSELLKDQLASVRVAIDQLTRRPVTPASRATRLGHEVSIRKLIDDELDALWAGKKPAKAALDDAVSRSRSMR